MAHEHDVESGSDQAALALLPWLVNDTLGEDDTSSARELLGRSLDARRQKRELEALAQVVRAAPLVPAHAELGLERLRARLGEAPAFERNWARPTRPQPAPPPKAWHRGAAIAAGLVLALLASEAAREPTLEPEYRALTTAPAGAATLRVVFDATLDAAAIDARLAAHGARRVGAIGARNVVAVEVADARSRAKLAAALARDPAVRLVGDAP